MMTSLSTPELPTDLLPFILKSWLRSYRLSHQYVGHRDAVYYRVHGKIAINLLRQSRIIDSYDKTDKTHAYGYLVYEISPPHLILHYIYVKKSFRRLGIARALLADLLSREHGYTSLIVSHCPVDRSISRWIESQGFDMDISFQQPNREDNDARIDTAK